MKMNSLTSIKGVTPKVALAVVMAASSHAATITFDAATTFSSVTVLDAPYSAGYSFVTAMNVGDGTEHTVNTGTNSVTFLSGTGAAVLGNSDMPAVSSSTTGFYNGGTQWSVAIFAGGTGSSNFDDVLRGNSWHNTSDDTQPLTLRLAGLTLGETYAVYLYSVDQRQADRTQAYRDGFAPTANFTGATSGSFSQSDPTVVRGVFTADATYQDVFIQETDGLGGDDTHLSAFALYSVPEPSSALLLSGAALLFGFCRRR